MNIVFKNLAIKSAQSVFDLIIRLILFLVLISPLVIWKLPLIKQLAGGDLFLSRTGFYIPDLLSDSLGISLVLIFCSLAVSCYFGLLLSLAGTFKEELSWLPSLFVIVSTIPVFITAYYLPYILLAVLLLVILLSGTSGKPWLAAGLSAVLLFMTVAAVSYLSQTGALDLLRQTKPGYLPQFVLNNFDSIIQKSTFITEQVLPVTGLIFPSLIFLIYIKKHPLYSSLTTTFFLGFLGIYAIIVYGYRTRIENTYLLGPILALAGGNLVLGLFINQLQEGIREQLRFDYMKAAVAKGASLWNHLRRKILLIILHAFKSQFPLLLSLTIIVEKIYNLEGIGYLTWEYAVRESDLLTVTWIVALCFLLVWIFNQAVDLLVLLIFHREAA
ncbi:MAG: hypothetical protein ACE5GM_06850 [bacterium]